MADSWSGACSHCNYFCLLSLEEERGVGTFCLSFESENCRQDVQYLAQWCNLGFVKKVVLLLRCPCHLSGSQPHTFHLKAEYYSIERHIFTGQNRGTYNRNALYSALEES